jgi:dTDP-glucose 4,6-dehydratase
MTRIIVTGGAGFIGANFVRHLLSGTSEACRSAVCVVDKLTYAGHRASLDEVAGDPRLELVEADIADRAAMDGVLRRFGPDAIVHFAAETHVDRSIDDPEPFVRTNVLGTYVLLEAARRHWERLERPARFRFLHVSTDEVYGTLGPEGRFREDTPYAPSSPYAASKAGADHLVRAYRESFGLPTVITNCSNNYGPFQFPEKLIPLMTLNALEGKPLPIYGDGGNVRDWLYVVDHCEGLAQVLERGRVGEKYNLGGRCERTNLEMVDALCAALESVRPARENPALATAGIRAYAELKTFVPDRPGHDRRYAIDTGKVERELGWRPRFSLAEGLRLTVRWLTEHRDWCATVQGGRDARTRLGLGLTGG